jgi:hypothetical protein
MLDIILEDQEGNATVSIVIIIIIPGEDRINCDLCNQEALIFQIYGNFCLRCWQNKTEPDIS